MQAFLTLTRRELGSFFVSLIGYVVIGLTVSQIGLSFVILLTNLQNQSTPVPLAELFYATPFFWIILLLATPLITMRLFALEKFSGTFETLMTAPVSDLAVVMAKFCAALIFYFVLWLPLAACILISRHYTSDPAALDLGALGGMFIGILCLGCLYVSMGCFASALSRSQIIAAVVSLALGLSFFLVSFLSDTVSMQTGLLLDVINYVNIVDQMHDFARGVVDTRHVIFYASGTVFFLFLTYRVIESRRWK